MTVPDQSSWATAAPAVGAAALLVAGGGSNGSAEVVGGSNNTSVCAYAKHFGSGHVYVEISVFATPHTGAGLAFCRSSHPGHGFKRISYAN